MLRSMSIWLPVALLSAPGPHAGAGGTPVAPADAQAQEPAAPPMDLLVGATALGWDAGSGEVRVATADGAVAAFDVFLQPLAEATGPLPDDSVRVADGVAVAPVWSGRALELDARLGRLRLGAASWEVPPRLRWGPGWVCIELRSTQAGGRLDWRHAGRSGAVRFRCDRDDGLWQRAWVEGLEPGGALGLRWMPPRREWPRAPVRPGWSERTVPQVDPAGERPTEAWR